jgi:hypothetical protein
MNGRLPSFADPANLVTREEPKQPVIPKGITAPELAEMVMRGEVKLSPQQMRVMIELLPFHAPKLTAVAVGSLNGQDFAARLERALQRSEGARFPKLIEAQPVPTIRA